MQVLVEKKQHWLQLAGKVVCIFFSSRRILWLLFSKSSTSSIEKKKKYYCTRNIVIFLDCDRLFRARNQSILERLRSFIFQSNVMEVQNIVIHIERLRTSLIVEKVMRTSEIVKVESFVCLSLLLIISQLVWNFDYLY